MPETTLRIATRKSKLALTQTNWVADQLRALQPRLKVELVTVVTVGDRVQDVSLSEIGGKGLFVSEVEQAVLEGRAELAVHSLKDVPAELAEGLCLACVPEREDPRDVLVTRDGAELEDLSAGDRIGTNSLRRSLQLRRQRNDLEYAMLRGNVDTRLAKLEAGDYRAIVLAYAGLRRLGLADRPLQALSVDVSIPAVGQGALAIEARLDDPGTLALLARLEHAPSRLCVNTERAFLGALGGDCSTPLAGHARFDARTGNLRFDGMVGSVHTTDLVQASTESYLERPAQAAEQAEAIGREIAARLLEQGAAEYIAEAKASAPKKRDPRSVLRDG